MRLSKTINPLLWRVIVFLALFVIISGVIGPRIISGGILFRDGFALYGGVGKALIFGCIAFALLVRHQKVRVALRPWRPTLLGWMLAAAIAFTISWITIHALLAGERNTQTLLLAHGGLLACLGLLGAGCFGPANIQLLWRSYKRAVVQSTAIAAAFYVFLLGVYALWRPLASVTLHSVRGMLSLAGLPAVVVPPRTLVLDKFGITVAQYCSGIESIALFTGLYILVGLLDWQRINWRRYFLVFPFALLGLSLLNILRVFGLIMAGYYINPQVAFSLFHTYAGMVFFVLYSIVFWSVAYKYLVAKPVKQEE